MAGTLNRQAVVLPVLPAAVDPLALSLNENPFPPLPAVQSALIESIGVANRYPEFLPERLRRLIAAHIGVGENQVVLGAGATGVVMQVLHAVTGPGDRIVMTTPTFDGYPIFAQMARLESVTVPLDAHGHHDLDALADAASDARVVVLCRPHNPTGTLESAADVERFLRRVPPDTWCCSTRPTSSSSPREHRLDGLALVRRFPNVVVLRTFSKAYGLAGLRIGYGFGAPELAGSCGRCSCRSACAITRTGRGRSLLRRGNATAATDPADPRGARQLRMRLRAIGIYSTDAHANFVYLPPAGRPWRQVFDVDDPSSLRVRHYADGAVRITVGGRSSTRAVLAAIS